MSSSAPLKRGRVTYEGFAAAWPSMEDEVDGVILFAEDGRKVPPALADARTIGARVQLLTYERTAA